MRPLIIALILLAACTAPKPNTQEPPAMTASHPPTKPNSPTAKPCCNKPGSNTTITTNTKPPILPTKPRRRAKPCRRT